MQNKIVLILFLSLWQELPVFKDRRNLDRMVVGFTTIYAISAYHH